MSNVLQVLLYGENVGTLSFLPGEQTFFSFSSSYIKNQSRFPLSLSFKNNLGHLITDSAPTRMQVPPFFSNLLPEGPMRDYLAKRAGVNPKREFFLLQALGRDLPGAVTIEIPKAQSFLPEKMVEEDEGFQKNVFHFSLAGIQLKFSAIKKARAGLTIPTEGVGGSWIVKLPSTHFELVAENEYSMMTLAKKMGMDIPDLGLVPLNKISGLPENIGRLKGQALAIRRFDRTKSGPVHTEDFAQVFGLYPEEKYSRGNYKNIAEVLMAETGEESIEEFIRRLVFNTFIGNADMHLKNWSLIYPDRRKPKLAPGYDFVSTISYIKDENMGLNFVKSKQMAELSIELLSYFSTKARLPQKLVLDTAKDTVKRFREVWKKERKHLPLTSHMINTIEKNVQSIKLQKEVF